MEEAVSASNQSELFDAPTDVFRERKQSKAVFLDNQRLVTKLISHLLCGIPDSDPMLRFLWYGKAGSAHQVRVYWGKN